VPVVLLTQGGGHDHVLTVGVSIGPTVLRIALLAAIPVVAAFALLRGFLAEPDRRTLTAVLGTAGGAAVIVLLLSGGLAFSPRLVPVVLALLTVPLYLARSGDPRFARAVGLARRCAPWIFWPATALAFWLFTRALLAGGGPERTATLLHTGVVVALVALSWFAVSAPRRAAGTLSIRLGAAALALVLLACAAQATVLRIADDPRPSVAATPR
jgi:hypothetical protein